MNAPQPSDRRASYAVIALCAVAVIGLVVWGAATLVPQIQAWVTEVFSPGLGLRTSAIIAAVVAFSALIVLTLAAGDGLLGEIQFVIPGFFLFFLFFWLMTAWVF
jgi:hypothetical protein